MKLQTFASCSAFLVTLALSFGTSRAVDVVDLQKAPGWYASETVEMDNGQPVKRIVFSAQPVAISMLDLNRILAAYGLSVVDAKRAPAGYMEETRSSGSGEVVVVFDSQPKGLAPMAIDGVLAAYGLRVVDPSKLPASYGTQTTRKNSDGSEVIEVMPSSGAYAVSPAEWHRILSAYGK
jgi:hypothetical protein